MTQIELIGKIKAEIERRIEIAEHRIDNNRELENTESVDIEQLIKWNAKRDLQICHQDGKAEALKDILSFIESLEQSIDADKMIGLDEAAEDFARNWYARKYGTMPDRCRGCYAHIKAAVEFGAKWMAEQYKTLGETEIYLEDDGEAPYTQEWLDLETTEFAIPEGFQPGDKVIVQIRKK